MKLTLMLLVACLVGGCMSEQEQSKLILMSSFNASDDTLTVLITKEQLHGSTWHDYTWSVYPQYQKDSILFENEKIALVQLWGKPEVRKKDADNFFRLLAQSNVVDTTFHYTVSSIFTSAKNY